MGLRSRAGVATSSAVDGCNLLSSSGLHVHGFSQARILQPPHADTACAIAIGVLPSAALAALGPAAGGNITVRLQTVASWQSPFSGPNLEIAPSDLAPFNDGSGRLLVATLGGTLRVIDGDGNLVSTPLLSAAQTGSQIQQEAGMTGIALHPDFATPGAFGYGKLYTITTENRQSLGGRPDSAVDFPAGNEAHQDVVREWNLSALVGNSNRQQSARRDSRRFARNLARRPTGGVPQRRRSGVQYARAAGRSGLRPALHLLGRRLRLQSQSGSTGFADDLRQYSSHQSRSHGAQPGAHQPEHGGACV